MLDKFFTLSQTYIRNYNKSFVRYFLKSVGFEHRLTILLGQRGVGKTTTIIQYILQAYDNDMLTKKALFIQADHFLTSKTSLYEIAEEFVKNGGELLCVDEIHKYKNWSIELKSIYDTFVGLKIIASGSSALEIYKGSHDLSRRAIVYKMLGMSFREFIELYYGLHFEAISLGDILSNHERLAESIISPIESAKQKIIPIFKEYLRFGHYPYYFDLRSEELFFITLEQNIHSTVENDLLFVYPSISGNSVKKILALLGVIRQSVPFTPDMSRLKRAVDVGDERTLKNYLKYLEDAGLIRQLPKSSNPLSAIEKPEKIYLDNPNLLYIDDANIGSVRETYFLSMVSSKHRLCAANAGDFLIDENYTVEVGGNEGLAIKFRFGCLGFCTDRAAWQVRFPPLWRGFVIL
jgi:uncharacterized protein